MELTVERVAVWVAGIKDEPGGLAGVLTALREAGADLNFLIARRAPDKPGEGVVFLTPLGGDAQVAAAGQLGFTASRSIHSVRAEGVNEPGVAAKLTETVAAAGINVRGMSGAVIGARFVLMFGLDSEADANRVVELLRAL